MFGEKAAIKKYLKTLPSLLSRRYGRSDKYTEGQVKTTIYELGLNKKYIGYAYLIFCNQASGKEFSSVEISMINKIQKVAGITAGSEATVDVSTSPLFQSGSFDNAFGGGDAGSDGGSGGGGE